MIEKRPDVALDGRYTITRAAELLQIDRTTLLRYCKTALAKCSYNHSHRRIFSGQQIIDIWNKA